MANISDRIKELRLSKHMTQAEFGNVFGIVKSTISLYESGKSSPNDQIKTQICEYFNVSMDYLLGLTEEKSSFRNFQDNLSKSTTENNLRFLISKTGYGDDELAEKLGISEELLEDYCSGTIHPPLNILQSLCDICEVSTDYLLGLREKSRPKQNNSFPFKFDPEISLRLKELARDRNENYSILADILGINEDEVFNFFEYGFVLHIEVLSKIVEHFLVSSDYLLNRSNSTLTLQKKEEERLLQVFRSLNEDSRIIALSKLLELKREDDLVAAKNRFLDDSGKSSPSSGTEGGSMIG